MTSPIDDSIAQYQVVCADAAHMDLLRDREADLILASPPYFSDETARLLERPRHEQRDLRAVSTSVFLFAQTLQPVFREMARVLKLGRACILQTRDLHYGDALIDLAGIHREMMEAAGFALVTRVLWQKSGVRADAYRSRGGNQIGCFRAAQLEEFLVFGLDGRVDALEGAVDLTAEELASCMQPLWRLRGAGAARTHPYQSPRSVVRRLIALFSRRDDLVVDPFLGHGTTLRVAVEMGRRGVGYEVQASDAQEADRQLERIL